MEKEVHVSGQNYHMQGFACGKDAMFWSFTDTLVKTSPKGELLGRISVPDGHLGDLDYDDGKIYASLLGHAKSGCAWNDWSFFEILVFCAEDLCLLDRFRPDILAQYKQEAGHPGDTRGFQGIDGIAVGRDPESGKKKLFAACATETGEAYQNQLILQFSMDGQYEREYRIPTGNTVFGIQNLDYDADTGCFWFSTYGKEESYQPKEKLYRTNREFTGIDAKYCFSSPYGFACLGGGNFYASAQGGVNGARSGCAYLCREEFFRTPKTEEEASHYVQETFGLHW